MNAFPTLMPDGSLITDGWTDLGHDHWFKTQSWEPDRTLNPQWAHLDDVPQFSAMIAHITFVPSQDEEGNPIEQATWCHATILFASDVADEVAPPQLKRYAAHWDPIDVPRRIVCPGCGDRGRIQHGTWVPLLGTPLVADVDA